MGAGDISSCANAGDTATANLLDTIGGTVITLGDNAYENGTTAEFANCYDPTWGRNKARMRPAVGNHEYGTAGATGYYSYFGAVAGDAKKGYYSYDLGAWHLLRLTATAPRSAAVTPVGSRSNGCGPTWPPTRQPARWPTGTTRASARAEHGSNTAVQALWQALYDANADLVLNGHDHHYERFAPQDPTGTADAARGLREFIVGTGGRATTPRRRRWSIARCATATRMAC